MLAEREGWRIPRQEVALYQGPMADSAFALRVGDEPRGFVTVMRHEKSGWIGNLLVDPECRGRGYGSLLFEHAVDALRARNIGSVWLTASEMGRPIYEKRGFRLMGGVVRWVFSPSGASLAAATFQEQNRELLYRGDHGVWGESRCGLLEPLSSKGKIFAFGNTVALLQQVAGVQVIGPWVSENLCPRENRQLLMALISAAEPQWELVADVLEASPVQQLLGAAGFERQGRCDLMALDPQADLNLSPLVSFASLGSMG